MGEVVATIAALSLTVTKIVDFIRNATGAAPKWVWNLVAFVVGIMFAFGWKQNISADLLKQVPAFVGFALTNFWGTLLTGVVIGGAAGFWHELLDMFSSIAKRRAVREV